MQRFAKLCVLVLGFLSLTLTSCGGGGGGGAKSPEFVGAGEVHLFLGDGLERQISATDADGTAVPVMLMPLPLPRNAEFDELTGLFAFTPDEDQVGPELTFTLEASGKQGLFTDTLKLRVLRSDPGSPTRIAGLVCDSEGGVSSPLVGAEVRIPGTSLKVSTGADGRFDIGPLPAEARVIEIDGLAASPRNTWAYVAEDIALLLGHRPYEEQRNVVVRPIYLPKLGPPAGRIGASGTSEISNENATLIVAAGTARQGGGQAFEGDMFVPRVAPGRTPAALPRNLQPSDVVAIQPAGLLFNPPAPLRMPNREGFPTGTRFNLWSIDPNTGVFVDVGDAEVEGDEIVTMSGGVRNSSWHFFAPGSGEGNGDGDDGGGDNCNQGKKCKGSVGSEVDFQTGELSESYTVPGFRARGAKHDLTFTYHSGAADPQPIVNGDVTIPIGVSVPPTYSTTLTVGGLRHRSEIFRTARREESRVAHQFDATMYTTGWYPYALTLTNNYPQTRVATQILGELVVRNEIKSAFGAGWTLEGLDRIYTTQDPNRVVMAGGDGSTMVFIPDASPTNAIAIGAEVCFLLDGSGSIEPRDFTLELEGFARAVETASVIPHNSSISVAVVQIGARRATLHVPLTNIDSEATAMTVATQIRAIRQLEGGTPLHLGIDQCVDVFENASPGARQLICIATDGNPDDRAAAVASARRAERRGVDGIDAVAVGQEPSIPTLREIVRTGGVAVVRDFAAFAEAVSAKVRRALSSAPAGEFSKMSRDTEGNYLWEFPDGSKKTFFAHRASDVRSGLLRDMVDRNGNRVDYTYDEAGRLVTLRDTTVGDGGGTKEVRLDYAPDTGLLRSITMPGGTVTQFEHTGTTLTRILDAEGAARTFGYDANRRLISQKDKRGNETAYIYNAFGRLKETTHLPTGDTRKLVASAVLGLGEKPFESARDKAEPVEPVEDIWSTFTDALGKETRIRTDKLGVPRKVTSPLNYVTERTLNVHGLPEEVIHPNGRRDLITYDLRYGRPISVTEAVGLPEQRTTTYEYHARFGFATKITDPYGSVEMTYDNVTGNLLSVKDKLGRVRTFAYYENGLLRTAQDERSTGDGAYTTTYTYRDGELTDVAHARRFLQGEPVSITHYERDAHGNVTSITEGFGSAVARTRRFEYDREDRVTASIDEAGGRTSFRYDVDGNLLETELPTGEKTIRTYDSLGRLARIADPLRGVTDFGSDPEGNVTERRDALGRLTQFTYDDERRLIEVLDPREGREHYEYDTEGNVTAFTNARGRVTRFVYDKLNRRLSMTTPPTTIAPQGRTRRWEYDSVDNVELEHAPDNSVVDYVYDTAHFRLLRRVSGTDTTLYDYDSVGNLTLARRGVVVTAFDYDARNRVISEDTTIRSGPTVRVSTGYDAAGNVVAYADNAGSGRAVSYSYDYPGRRTVMSLPVATGPAPQLTLSTDAAGRLESIIYPNGVVGRYGYQGATGRLSSISHARGSTQVLGLGYVMNAVGNIASMTDADAPQQPRNFTYDKLDRLTSGTVPTSGAALEELFAYDRVGNRVSAELVLGGTATPIEYQQASADNQILEDTQFTYTYDLRGNMTTRLFKPSGPTQTFVWSGLNELAESRPAPDTVARYTYDGLGRRVEKSITRAAVTEVRRYIYNGEHIAVEMDASNVVTARYVFGPQVDQVLAQVREGTASPYFCYHADHLGSVRRITDSAGAVVSSYTYDAYGQPLEGAVQGVENPFWFTGREEASEIGLYYYRARWYDPRSGRFLSEEAFGFDGLNSYWYGRCGPLLYVDPTGLGAEGAAIGGVIGAGVGGVLGGIAGGAIGGTGGGIGGTLALPGGGTIGGSILGANAGATVGAGLGATVGAAIGAGIGSWAQDLINLFSENIRDTGLRDLSDQEVQQRARDKSLPGEERRRYQKEEKSRKLRNKQKRGNKDDGEACSK